MSDRLVLEQDFDPREGIRVETIEVRRPAPFRVAVHQDNKAMGNPNVWMIEDGEGKVFDAREVVFLGESWTMTGQLRSGPTLWVQTIDPIKIEVVYDLDLESS